MGKTIFLQWAVHNSSRPITQASLSSLEVHGKFGAFRASLPFMNPGNNPGMTPG